MPNRWNDEQKFMVLGDSFWSHTADNQWDIMHGSHTIYLYDDNCFYNNYSWNDSPQLKGELNDACIMTAKFIYAVTAGMESPFRKDYMSTDYDDRSFDYEWEDMQWRMEEAAKKMKKRRYLV